MARTRKAFLHVGLPSSGGDFLHTAFADHADALAAAGLRHPAISHEEMFRAALEIRRDHRAWGYQRREVEGAWAAVCRRAHHTKDDVVLSQDLLTECTPEQIDLLLDTLDGFEAHAIVTARGLGSQLVAAWAGSPEQDLAIVLDRWAGAVRAPQRVHVVVVPPTGAQAAIWRSVGAIAGFDAAALPLAPGSPATADPTGRAVVRHVGRAAGRRLRADLDEELLALGERWRKALADGGYDVHGDTSDLLPHPAAPATSEPDELDDQHSMTTDALANVLVEVTRLREHNRALEERNAKLERKRKKLKRKLAASAP